MKTSLDSSILISALCAGDPDHDSCHKVLVTSRPSMLSHGLAETFSTLTGGQFRFQLMLRGPKPRPLSAHVQRVLAKTPLPEDVIPVFDMDALSFS